MKKQGIFLSLMTLVLLFALAACGQKEESKKAEEKTKTVDTVKGKVEIRSKSKAYSRRWLFG
nr:hypothetical protein [Bacillus pumilus]